MIAWFWCSFKCKYAGFLLLQKLLSSGCRLIFFCKWTYWYVDFGYSINTTEADGYDGHCVKSKHYIAQL